MNTTSAPNVSGIKEKQQLKEYTVCLSGRFYQFVDVMAVDENHARELAVQEANPKDCEGWDYLDTEVHEVDGGGDEVT